MKALKYLLFVLLVTLGTTLQATVLLPQILSSNMVLQRDKPIAIWGFAAPGEHISVEFAGQKLSTETNQSGTWKVMLSSLKTSSVPAIMTIIGTNTIILENILVGEVWLCSGQSNMEYAMRKIKKVKKPLNPKLGFPADELENAKNPQIRIFLVNRKQLIKPDSIHKSWSVAQDSALKIFSAAGYFFAKELQEKLGIPIGIISSAVSGSAIEPWIQKEVLLSEPFFKDNKPGNDPGKFYTPMIEPLTQFAIRGFLWYQGETNCFLKENISYSYKMKALINSWRAAWGNPEMPFYYVQIAPFEYSKSKGKIVLDAQTEPEFWEAQSQLLRLKNTGMVVSTDLNDFPEDLHPTYKWEVGRRLALWALAKDYGKKVTYSGPMFKAVQFKSNAAEIAFKYTGKGLVSVNGQPLKGFSIAGADGIFVLAQAQVKGDKIRVFSKSVKHPKSVRFGWNETSLSNLYNKDGLPAMPFRTDNPLTEQFKTNDTK
jgi:sialate O-acetylesterase